MNTELPCEPAGQVPIGGWSAPSARVFHEFNSNELPARPTPA